MLNLRVNTANVQNSVSPLLYGIFFEDINYGGDGGLYAELIANRSFEYYDRENQTDLHQMCWETVGNCRFTIGNRFPLSQAHANYAVLSGKAGDGIRNLGFCKEGLAVKKNQTFRFSCYVRNAAPMRLTVRFAADGFLYGEKTFSAVRAGCGWSKYTMTLTASGDCRHVYPEILLASDGSLDIDLISLFPTDTFRGRKNGLRKDLAEMLEALHPAFMRFPGGCIVEGRSFKNMYNWKETIGALTERRTNWNRWQMDEYQLESRSSADYFQSYGLGYYEYFQFCEDIGAKPVPVMNVGMTCQWHESLLADMDKLDKWIQDILDLIEFANAPADTGWGQRRAALGHPEPFGLEYIGIGNEQWGAEYFKRYEAFEQVLSKKHPEIRLITCAGWTAEGEDFDYAYRWMNENKEKAYAVDEHFYKSKEWFWENLYRYDSYDRSLPKVFAGEYAAHSDSDTAKRVCNWDMALSEAAFLTGLEHNGDHVVMSCYAPLFGRTGHTQWQPDLIWFDNDSVYGTPSYYVQQLFSCHTGADRVELSAAADHDPDSLPASATLSADRSTLYIKLVNPGAAQTVTLTPDRPFGNGTLYQLWGDPADVNSHEAPKKVFPVQSPLCPEPDAPLSIELPACSVTVIEIELLPHR